MLIRNICLAMAVVVFSISACGSGDSLTPAQQAVDAAAGLELQVMDESFLPGSSAAGFSLATRSTSNILQVAIHVEAADSLKALYYSLDYDASRLSLLDMSISEDFTIGGEVLSILQPIAPGRLSGGQVLASPQWRSGYSGSGELVQLRFLLQPEGNERTALKVNTTPSASPLDILWDNDNQQLSWYYNNPADYDQNGEVNVADLTPLAQNFLAEQPGGFDVESAQSVVDGDGNGLINLADITPIGVNFGNSGSGGYHVFEELGGSSRQIGQVPLDSGQGERGSERLRFFFNPPVPEPGASYFPQLADGDDNLGFAPPPVDGPPDEPPVIVLAGDDEPGQGDGSETDPFILTDEIIADFFSFSIIDDGVDVTGESGVFIRSFAAEATLSIEQQTGEVQFDPAWENTAFYMDGIVGSVETANRIHFVYTPAREILLLLDEADTPPGGNGSQEDPYQLTDAIIGNIFTFSVTEDGLDVTGGTGVTIRCFASDAALSIDQSSGEVQFNNAWIETPFHLDADIDGVVSDNQIHFTYFPDDPAPFYILPDPDDLDWQSVPGDGKTEQTAFVVSRPEFNSDGSVEFSFIASSRADGMGSPLDVASLTWDAGFPFMITNGWASPGVATFSNTFTNTNVFARNAELVNSNDIWVVAQPFI